MPVLVPLIWPLVILSAREVAAALPGANGALRRPVIVGALVALDASLVEVVAVRAGLWGWVEGGHLGVPIIGVLGWAFFAGAADALLASRMPGRRLAVIALAPAAAHALILTTWWGALRWTLRGPLGDASVAAVVLLGAVGTGLAARARARGAWMDPVTAVPRITAAALFVALLVATAPGDARLWLHTASVAAPYLAMTRLRPRALTE